MIIIKNEHGPNEKKLKTIQVKNSTGLDVTFLNLGASIIDLKVPDFQGKVETILVTPKRLEDFIRSNAYFGKTCGRTAGRIDKGHFSLNQQSYNLERNWNGVANLHGGSEGLSEQFWDDEVLEKEGEVQVIFSYLSPDKESQFPGNLQVKVIYHLYAKENTIRIEYFAQADQDTLCNLTNHSYFNLSGNVSRNILKQKLMIASTHYTILNNNLICEKIGKVNEIMDFRKMHAIGDFIEDEFLQNHTASGYDHAFLFDVESLEKVNVKLFDDISKRKLEIRTTYPSVVVYTSNYPIHIELIGNKIMEKYDGVCLETLLLPNGIHMHLPKEKQGILTKDELYHHQTIWKFSVE